MSSNKPILYTYFRSSCSWRVRIALAFKNVEYESRPVSLLKNEQTDEEYIKLNPMGQVPALVIDNQTMTQSLSILEFIEEKYPQNPLLPKNLFLKAKVRDICNMIASGIQPLQNLNVLKRVGDEGKMQWAHDFIKIGFIALEQVLSSCSGKYCVADDVTFADCCLVPQVYNAGRFNVDMTPYPTIKRINDNLALLDAFKVSHPSKQVDCPVDLQ